MAAENKYQPDIVEIQAAYDTMSPEQAAMSRARAAVLDSLPPSADRLDRLAAEFDAEAAGIRAIEGENSRQVPFVTTVGELTQEHISSIASVLSRPEPHTVKGDNVTYGDRGNGPTISIDTVSERELIDIESFMGNGSTTINSANFRSDDVVVRGRASVSFVRKLTEPGPAGERYKTLTINPHITRKIDEVHLAKAFQVMNRGSRPPKT